jgi:hypothetical protein
LGNDRPGPRRYGWPDACCRGSCSRPAKTILRTTSIIMTCQMDRRIQRLLHPKHLYTASEVLRRPFRCQNPQGSMLGIRRLATAVDRYHGLPSN